MVNSAARSAGGATVIARRRRNFCRQIPVLAGFLRFSCQSDMLRCADRLTIPACARCSIHDSQSCAGIRLKLYGESDDPCKMTYSRMAFTERGLGDKKIQSSEHTKMRYADCRSAQQAAASVCHDAHLKVLAAAAEELEERSARSGRSRSNHTAVSCASGTRLEAVEAHASKFLRATRINCTRFTTGKVKTPPK